MYLDFEIRENKLFNQPDESYLGECPICCLPLSIDSRKSTINSCCCKLICNGCCHANEKREIDQGLEGHKCAFCREPLPKTDEENLFTEIFMYNIFGSSYTRSCKVGREKFVFLYYFLLKFQNYGYVC